MNRLLKSKSGRQRKERSMREKILLTVGLLILARVLAQIPVPGVNREYLSSLLDGGGGLKFLDIMSGGGLEKLSVVAMGITPYITASIILQLLCVVFERLKEMRKDGMSGQKKYEAMTYGLGVILAAVEGISMCVGFGRQGMLTNYTWYMVLLIVALWTAGCGILMFFGHLIDKDGIGNGMSLILAINIMASFPNDLYQLYLAFKSDHLAITLVKMAGCGVMVLVLIFGIVQIQEAAIQIRVQHARKISGYAQKSTLPLKVNVAGVVPVIFASTIMTFPYTVMLLAGKSPNLVVKILTSSYWFNPTNMLPTVGIFIYLVLLVFFSFFYADMVFNVDEIADNLKKSGSSIMGIRPGVGTRDFLRKKMNNMLILGSFALSIVAVIPMILAGVFDLSSVSFLGTSLIIVVSVVMDTKDRLTAQTKSEFYQRKSFLGI